METKQLPQFVAIVIDGVEQYQIQKTNEIKDKLNSEIPKKLISYVNEHESNLKELANFGVDIDEIEKLQSLDLLSDLLSRKDFLELKTKICSSKEIYKDLYPLNAKVVTLLILTQTSDLPSYSKDDFYAECIYYADRKEYQKIIKDIWKGQAALNNLGLVNLFDYDFEVFEELSNIIKSVVSELEKLHTSPIKILKGLGMDDKIIELLLSGKQEDWEIFTKLDIELPEDISLKNLLAITIFIQLYHKIKSKEIETPNNLIPDDIQEVTISYSIFDKVYQMEKEKHPDDYNIWKNYIDDNWIISCEIKDYSIGLLHTLTMVDECYADILNIYFDIIYNTNYSEAYRADIIKLLKNEEYVAILPYYGEYCKEHNISADKYYYLGDIPEKNEESSGLSYIDSESPDKDTEQHFGLALKSNQVEYLYNELKGTYLDASTDIRLFCYRLTGKGKPDKIEKLKWVSDDDSLAVFIKHLGVSKNKCWQKTESFFGNKNENLKSRYHRLTKQKGKLKVNDINLTNLDNILASIKTNA